MAGSYVREGSTCQDPYCPIYPDQLGGGGGGGSPFGAAGGVKALHRWTVQISSSNTASSSHHKYFQSPRTMNCHNNHVFLNQSNSETNPTISLKYKASVR